MKKGDRLYDPGHKFIAENFEIIVLYENGKPYSCKNITKAIKTAARNIIVKILEKLTK